MGRRRRASAPRLCATRPSLGRSRAAGFLPPRDLGLCHAGAGSRSFRSETSPTSKNTVRRGLRRARRAASAALVSAHPRRERREPYRPGRASTERNKGGAGRFAAVTTGRSRGRQAAQFTPVAASVEGCSARSPHHACGAANRAASRCWPFVRGRSLPTAIASPAHLRSPRELGRPRSPSARREICGRRSTGTCLRLRRLERRVPVTAGRTPLRNPQASSSSRISVGRGRTPRAQRRRRGSRLLSASSGLGGRRRFGCALQCDSRARRRSES